MRPENKSPYADVEAASHAGVRVVGGSTNRWISVAVGVFCAVWVGKLGTSGFPLSLLLGAVLWLYLVSIAFLVVSVVARFYGVAPKLPLIPVRHCGAPRITAGLALVVMTITALREGAAAPEFVLQLNWWTASHTLSRDVTSSFSSSTLDGNDIAFRDRPIHCSLNCQGDEVGCAMVDALVTCDDRPSRPEAVSVDIRVTLPAVDCYVPLSKSLQAPYSGQVGFSVANNKGHKSGSLSLQGQVELHMDGMASCYSFRRTVGELVATDLIGIIDGHLADN